MQTSLKKRLEIIIEMPAVPRLEGVLEKAGVKGWTVLPAKAGRGAAGSWSREGQITDAGRMIWTSCCRKGRVNSRAMGRIAVSTGVSQ